MERFAARLGVTLNQEKLALIGQLVRFGLIGGFMTILVAAAYWVVAELFHVDPLLSMTMVYLSFTGLGYLLHSRISFRDHGSRDNAHIRTVRFFTVNTLGFFSNQLFVWYFTKYLGGPTWWPIPACVIITPIITFTLNRVWVFK